MPIPAHLSRLAGPALRVQPDARLVELVREGHERAFEEIVRRYRGPLTGFAGGIVPPHRAEDVVQESFSSALLTLRSDDREVALKAWLYTIVRNRSLNSLRDEPRHEQIDPQHDGVPQPPDIAARRAEVASLVTGLKGLPDQQREAIVQRELSGFGHEQIAGNLGVSTGAVRQLIFRARTNLRDACGMLIPIPVLRQMLEAAAVRSGGAEVAIAGGGGAAAVKVAVALLATGAAVGGGTVALEHRSHPALRDAVSPAIADAAPVPHHHHASAATPAQAAPREGARADSSRPADRSRNEDGGQQADASESGSPSANSGPSTPAGSNHGPSPSGSGGRSGEGDDSSGHSGSDDSGSDHGDDGGGSDSSGHDSADDHSGPSHSGGDDGPSGGSGSSAGEDDETSGDDDPPEIEEPEEGHSGPGPGHDEGSGSGDEPDD